MTTLVLFLTLLGAAFLPMLFCRRLRLGAALLAAAGALICLCAGAQAADAIQPGFLKAGAWVMFGLGMLGLAGGTIYAFLHRKRMAERLSGPVLPLFLGIGTVCALLGYTGPAAGGFLSGAEAMILALGGEAVSFALPVCAAACAALADEAEKPLCGLLLGLILTYAFGVFGLRTSMASAAAAALFGASAMLLFAGSAPGCACPAMFAPAALVLHGGALGWIGAVMLLYAALRRWRMLRLWEPERNGITTQLTCAAVLFLLAILLRACLGEGGLLALPSRAAAVLETVKASLSSFTERVSALNSEGVSAVTDGARTVLITQLAAMIPLLIVFFFVSRYDRRLSLRLIGFFLLAALFMLAAAALGLVVNGVSTLATAAPPTLLLCLDLFLLLRPAARPGRGWINVLCALTATAVIFVCAPPAARFARTEAILPEVTEAAELPEEDEIPDLEEELPGETALPEPEPTPSPVPVETASPSGGYTFWTTPAVTNTLAPRVTSNPGAILFSTPAPTPSPAPEAEEPEYDENAEDFLQELLPSAIPFRTVNPEKTPSSNGNG